MMFGIVHNLKTYARSITPLPLSMAVVIASSHNLRSRSSFVSCRACVFGLTNSSSLKVISSSVSQSGLAVPRLAGVGDAPLFVPYAHDVEDDALSTLSVDKTRPFFFS